MKFTYNFVRSPTVERSKADFQCKHGRKSDFTVFTVPVTYKSKGGKKREKGKVQRRKNEKT